MGDQAQPLPHCPRPHVVGLEVWVVPLYAVVQDGDHHTLAGQAPVPGLQDVQVRLQLIVLRQAVGASVSEVVAASSACLPQPGRSPCTTALRTRDLWAPPGIASPAAARSAAQTTAPERDTELHCPPGREGSPKGLSSGDPGFARAFFFFF